MTIFNTDAIVLKQFDLGEADKIITFYSKKRGKIRAVARNARKGNNTLSGRVLPFTYNNITIYRGSSIDKINQVKNKFSFTVLREDLLKMAYASYIAEIIEKVGMENDSNPQLFSLLLTTYHRMIDSSTKELFYLSIKFKFFVLVILGFKPQLLHCWQCGKEVKISSQNKFDIAGGGIICSQCFQEKTKKDDIFHLSGESLQILKKFHAIGLKSPSKLRVSIMILKELDNFLDKFFRYHLDLKIKSQNFLHMIRDLG